MGKYNFVFYLEGKQQKCILGELGIKELRDLGIDEKPEVRGQKTEDRIQKQLIDMLAIIYSAYRGWKAAPTVIRIWH